MSRPEQRSAFGAGIVRARHAQLASVVSKGKAGALVLFLASISASAGFSIFQLAMGRLLGPEGYGEVATLLAFLALATVGGSAMQLAAARRAARARAGGPVSSVDLLQMLAVVSTVVFVLLLAAPLLLAGRLELSGAGRAAAVVFALGGAATVSSYLLLGLLLGQHRRLEYVVLVLISPVMRVAFGIVLVALGAGTLGAGSAVLMGSGLAFAIGLLLVWPTLAQAQTVGTSAVTEIASIGGLAIVASLILAAITSLDVLLVRASFSTVDSSVYGMSATLSRAIILVATPFTLHMFPAAATLHPSSRAAFRLLNRTLGLTLLTSLPMALVLAVFTHTIVTLTFGPSFEVGVSILQAYLPLAIVTSVLTTLVRFNVAVGNRNTILWFAVYAAAVWVLVLVFHPTPASVPLLLAAGFGAYAAFAYARIAFRGRGAAEYGPAEEMSAVEEHAEIRDSIGMSPRT